MDFKSIVILCGFICLVQSEDLFLGNGSVGKKIFDEEEKVSPTIWRQIQNVTINATLGEVISKIAVTDLRPDKKGEAKIVEGGLGHDNVTIELKSPTALRGYEFHIEVFTVSESEGKHLIESPRTNLDSTTKTGDNSDTAQAPAIVAEDSNDANHNHQAASSTTLANKNGDVKIYEVTTQKIDSQHNMDNKMSASKTETKRSAVDIVTENSRRDSSTLNPTNTPTKAETLITIEDASKMNHQDTHLSPLPNSKSVITPKSMENNDHPNESLEKDEPKPLTHPLFNIHQSTQAPSSTSELPMSTSTSKLNEKRETLNRDSTLMSNSEKMPSNTNETPLRLANDKIDVTTDKVNRPFEYKPVNSNTGSHISTHKPMPLL